MLVIFDLNGTLCHVNKSTKAVGQQGIYSKEGIMKAKPIYQGANTEIFARPSFEKIKNDLLVQNKKEFDLGLWSSAGLEDSQLLV